MSIQFPELEYDFETFELRTKNGMTVAYADSGDKDNGDVILFIHGLASYMPVWKKLMPLLKHRYRCIAIDLPGNGRSEGGIVPAAIPFHVSVAKAVIDHFQPQHLTLAGHSMGGQISIAAALDYPELIDRLLLFAPAGFEIFSDKEIDWAREYYTREQFASATPEQIRFVFEENFHKMPEDARFMIDDRIRMRGWKNFYNYSTVVINSIMGLLDYPVHHRLSEVRQPSLIFFGYNDALIPHPVIHKEMTTEELARRGAELMGNSRLVMLSECGHFVPYEKPESCAREILNS